MTAYRERRIVDITTNSVEMNGGLLYMRKDDDDPKILYNKHIKSN